MTSKKYHHGDLHNALIQAGLDILAQEGVHGLSLRKVASQAGVSHGAPYAHFADKQALIAAIATEGYRKLYERLYQVSQEFSGEPLRQLVEGAWAYVTFALDDAAHFRVTFSGIVAKEKAYPALVEATAKSFGLVLQFVQACQAEGILGAGEPDLMAVSIWGAVHGLISLIMDGQISHTVLERFTVRQMLLHTLQQFSRVELPSPYRLLSAS
jgi:AcrR family transcriptional regulator